MAHAQRKPFPRRTIPGSTPGQRQPVRITPSFNPPKQLPAAATPTRANPTIFSPGRKAFRESQAKDRATLGIGSPGGLTRQGLAAKLSVVGQATTRAKSASLPAKRDPFAEANRRRLEKGIKPASRATVNALSRA